MLDRLLWVRTLSIVSTNSERESLRCFAISLMPDQKSFSRLTDVLWPPPHHHGCGDDW